MVDVTSNLVPWFSITPNVIFSNGLLQCTCLFYLLFVCFYFIVHSVPIRISVFVWPYFKKVIWWLRCYCCFNVICAIKIPFVNLNVFVAFTFFYVFRANDVGRQDRQGFRV